MVVVLLLGRGARTTAPLDPDNPDPQGAQAIARVLADEGVEVVVVRDAAAFEATDVDESTTVLVTSTEQLGQSSTDRLLEHGAQADLVVVDPGPGTTAALGVDTPPYRVSLDEPRTAGCPAYAELELLVDDALEYQDASGCFDGERGSILTEPRPGLQLLGAGQALSNDQVLRADNAAAMLRLLGQHDRLVWYVPSLDDLVGDDGVSLSTLLPDWLRPGLVLGALALLTLVLWRGRRLGPLATEPLPVVVRAIESTRSRGRLYRRSGDRGHAAAVLRAAALTRSADRLGLGRAAPPTTVVAGIARRTGRPIADVEALLGPTATTPTSDHDLIELATRLDELDREVRRS